MEVVMKPLIRVLVLVLAAGLPLFCGCGKKSFYPPLKVLGFYPEKGISNKDLFKELKEAYTPAKIREGIANPDLTKNARNNIIYARKKVIDMIYEEYTGKLFIRRGWFELSTDLAGIGLNAAGTLASNGASQILSGIAGGLNAGRGAFNTRIFYERTMPVIMLRMDGKRKEVWKEIEKKLKLPASENEAKKAAENAAADKAKAAKDAEAKAEVAKKAAEAAATVKPVSATAVAATAVADKDAADKAKAAKAEADKAKATPPEFYTLLQALSDIEDYYTAGSLSNAIMELGQTPVSVEKKEEKTKETGKAEETGK
jgi:hypothetical protein